MSAYPTTVAERVREVLEGALPATSRVDFFAGEFFDADRVEELALDVRARDVYLIEVERVAAKGRPTTGAVSHTLQIAVYCCVSDLSSAVDQFRTSQQTAFDAAHALDGAEMPATPGVHSNGHFRFGGTAKEYHYPGVSVHAARVLIDLTYQSPR